MGRAGDRQVDGVKNALGHAYGGGAQHFAMWVVSTERRRPHGRSAAYSGAANATLAARLLPCFCRGHSVQLGTGVAAKVARMRRDRGAGTLYRSPARRSPS